MLPIKCWFLCYPLHALNVRILLLLRMQMVAIFVSGHLYHCAKANMS